MIVCCSWTADMASIEYRRYTVGRASLTCSMRQAAGSWVAQNECSPRINTIIPPRPALPRCLLCEPSRPTVKQRIGTACFSVGGECCWQRLLTPGGLPEQRKQLNVLILMCLQNTVAHAESHTDDTTPLPGLRSTYCEVCKVAGYVRRMCMAATVRNDEIMKK